MTGGEKKRKDERLRKEDRRKREGRVGCGTVGRRVRPSLSRTQRLRRSGGRRSSEEGKRSGSHHATINPLLSELARKHGAGGRDHRHTDVVEELKNAFELAERSSPGITNRLIEQILVKLQPGLSDSRLNSAMDNLSLR